MKKIIFTLLSMLLISALVFSLYRYFAARTHAPQETIKVGILHSLTGATAATEQPIINGTLLAIDEINQKGGVLGKQLEAVIADGKSNTQTYAAQAEHLINNEKVAVIFGGLTSASRKAIMAIVERHASLLFYPMQYGGLEQSPNIVYTGSIPNQQILPGVLWSFNNLGQKFFLVGSESLYSRTASPIIKQFAKSIGAEIVGEEYLTVGTETVKDVIQKISQAQPTVILNSLVGKTNHAFFKELRLAGISSEKTPSMSFNMRQTEIEALDSKYVAGDYVCRSYFHNIDNSYNKKFIKAYQEKYGTGDILTDSVESAYFGVHLWAQAVKAAGDITIPKVRSALKNQAYYAPEGIVHIDPETQHTWKFIRIGKIRFNKEINIIWESHKAIRPLPYPALLGSKESWDEFIKSLFTQWGNKWEKQSSS